MISIITISLSIIVAAIVVYLLLEKLKIIGTDIINYNNGVIRIGDDNIHSETNLAGDIKLNPEKYPNGPLYVIDGKIMSGLGHIRMYKDPVLDTRTLYQEFLVFKLKYTVIQNGLIDVTDSPAGFGLPLINVKVPGLYSVTVKGVLRNIVIPENIAKFGIVEDSNISNMYFREDSYKTGNTEYPINVVNRYMFIDKPVQLRYGIICNTYVVRPPYDHDIEFEMINVT